jgi:hypothetical protein
MPSRRVFLAALLGLGLLAAACSSSDQPVVPSPVGSGANGSFAASVASADLSVGNPQHFELGIFQSSGQGVKLVTFGTVAMRFSYLGGNGASPKPGPEATGTYLPAFGTTPAGPTPALSDPGTARGVYEADVTFDQPGTWQVDVTVDVQGAGRQSLQAAFPVGAKPALPAPGGHALRTQNLTMDSKGVPPAAIDSRALDGAPVPDPELHRTTIADALSAHHPIVVVFATPTYCVSQFCGPETDGLAALARRYGDRAVFIHIEIWRDFQKSVVNKAAADWLYRNGDLVEPWLYVIGSDGIIKDRWGPIADMNVVAKELAELPRMKS